jgi:Zn-finger nucleic acid-binding protein
VSTTPSYMCPRCKLTLTPEPYEGAHTLVCQTCYGYWIPVASLKTILTTQDTEFSVREKEHAFFPDSEFNLDTDGSVPCVLCGEEASKRAVFATVLIDICPGHGVWLDTGELKNIQILTGANEKVRTALLAAAAGD